MKASEPDSRTQINSVAVIGNYLPRQCGIATFTTDLVEALSAKAGDCRCRAIAMNDKPEGYPYPENVRFEINQDNLAEYRAAAEFLNINEVDIISLQHEFGIFGGPAGSHILKLLHELHMPVVTTLHTIMTDPSNKYKKVMMQLAELSDRLVVMSQSAFDILHSVYDVPKEKIVYIPHGIPDIPFVDPNYYKDQFGLMGKRVLLTFGLLSHDKGIEYVLQGLPKVVERFPDLAYIVLGATHPHVLESEGEKYRSGLQELVEKLNLDRHVIFENRFVSFEELCEYLSATDLYITPYTNEDQITSGTLAYAMGTGKAVISTPYWYAKEMLSDGRGRLVPFKDDGAMADAIISLLGDDAERHKIRKQAYDFNRDATWKEVSRQYFEVFQEVRLDRNRRPRAYPSSSLRPASPSLSSLELPVFKLDHMLNLTDDTGLLQHSNYTIANRNHGYCTDDNARALIVAVQAKREEQADPKLLDTLFSRYLAFLLHAFNFESGRFRNFMSYSRQWLESVGSEDSNSRALWGLGMAVSLSKQSEQLPLTATLFMRALRPSKSFESPRAIAFTLIGINAYLETFPGDSEARRIRSLLAERLFGQFEANESEDWPWPENQLAYSNGKLPHALLLTGHSMHREDILQMGFRALDWLLSLQTEDGHLTPIGNQGWYARNGKKARFDQQPLEANALIEACITAFHIDGDLQWLDRAMTCFNWFLGHNDLKLPLYDARSGGCCDGLQSDGVNKNEGAESTLAWLLSLQAMQRIGAEKIHPPLGKVKPAEVAK